MTKELKCPECKKGNIISQQGEYSGEYFYVCDSCDYVDHISEPNRSVLG